eukprot:365193-Chlamydomonas_euryale.AAC.16
MFRDQAFCVGGVGDLASTGCNGCERAAWGLCGRAPTHDFKVGWASMRLSTQRTTSRWDGRP